MKRTNVLWLYLLLAINPLSAEEIPAPYTTITEAEEGYSITINNTTAKDPEYSLEKIQSKIAGFQRMKNAGSGLLIGGISLNGLGTILIITGINRMINDDESNTNSDYYYDEYNDDPPEGFFQTYFGSISLGFGIPMTVAGAVLSSIGSKKLREYQGRLQRISVQLSPNKWSVVYSF